MYRAPLKEIRFAMHQLVGDGRLAGNADFPDYSIDYADSVLDEAASFAEGVLAPINAVGDRSGAEWAAGCVTMPPEFKVAYAQFVDAGWTTLRAPLQFGGQGAPTVLVTAVDELWSAANLAFKLCPMLTRAAVEAITHCGTDEQKQRFLPKLISGEWTGTMNLTESQAGSDLGAIRTRAELQGSHYRLHGEKIFITYGEHDYTGNIVHLVLARIDGSPPGSRGISMFIVPKMLDGAAGEATLRNDVRCSGIERKLGIHASPTCVMTYGSGEGAVGYLVGEPNRGLEYMFVMMNAARLSVGLEGYAVAERSYQKAAEWARNRVQGRPAVVPPGASGRPVPIAGHADVKRMLLTMRATIDAARAMTLYTALQLDIAGHDPDEASRAHAQARADLLIPIVKGWSTEVGFTLASLGIQVHGGMGFVEDTGAAQLLRDVRITTIYEGTTGIQSLDLIGRKLARDNGRAMRELVAQMRAELGQLEAAAGGARQSLAPTLEAVTLLAQATTDVLQATARGPQYAQAVAVPYLHLAGTVIGAWLMAKTDALAAAHLDEDTEFYAGKQQACRFYVQHLLPQTLALARVVAGGSESVVEADLP